jgi:hypothetical protein
MRGIFSVLIVSLFLPNGCNLLDKDNSPDGGTAVEIAALGELGFGADLLSCTKACITVLTSNADTNFVINSAADYEQLKIKASCLEIAAWPDVDFTKSTLLAGIIITPTSCSRIVREDLTLDPFNSVYTLMVTLQPGVYQALGAIFFWALTEKLPGDAEMVFLHKYNSIQ